MAKKGQILVFENVLIFTIGVTIFIMSFAVFSIYQTQFTYQGTSDQMGQIRDYITSSILMVAEKPADSSVTLQIPKTISGEPYEIILSPEGLNVTSRFGHRFSSLYSIQLDFQERAVPSTRGRITLKREGDQINIR